MSDARPGYPDSMVLTWARMFPERFTGWFVAYSGTVGSGEPLAYLLAL